MVDENEIDIEGGSCMLPENVIVTQSKLVGISLAREKNLLNIFPTNRWARIFSCRD